MPKLSACRGEKSSRQICGQEVWAQGHCQHGPLLWVQMLTKCHYGKVSLHGSHLVKSHLEQTPVWSNLALCKPIILLELQWSKIHFVETILLEACIETIVKSYFEEGHLGLILLSGVKKSYSS